MILPGFLGIPAKTPAGGGGSWANAKSVRYTGVDTAGSGRTNFGQPAAWSRTLTSQELTATMRFRRNGRDGVLFGSRSNSNGYFYAATSGGAIACTFGGNFASGGTVADATWYSLTVTVRNEAGTYVGRAFLGNSSTSILNTNAGSNTLSFDFYANARRGANNTDFAFGAWGQENIDELAIWTVGFTGAQHVEYDNSNVPFDLTTHSQAASLVSYFRCGDDAGDSSTNMEDIVGTANGTHENTSNVSYPSEVP